MDANENMGTLETYGQLTQTIIAVDCFSQCLSEAC